jgi:hypothetical protein
MRGSVTDRSSQEYIAAVGLKQEISIKRKNIIGTAKNYVT